MKKYNHNNSHVCWVLTRCLACSVHSAVHLSQFTPLQMEKLRQRRFDTSQTQCGICFFGSVTWNIFFVTDSYCSGRVCHFVIRNRNFLCIFVICFFLLNNHGGQNSTMVPKISFLLFYAFSQLVKHPCRYCCEEYL